MELTLINSREIALIQGMLYRTILVPHTEEAPHPYADKASKIGIHYGEMSRKHNKDQRHKKGAERTDHGLGSPHLHIWVGWMKLLAQEKELLDKADLAKVQKHLDDTTSTPSGRVLLAELIAVARMTKVRDSGIRRIQIQCTHTSEDLGKLLTKAILHYGGELKEGAAPRGPRERRCRNFLDNREEVGEWAE